MNGIVFTEAQTSRLPLKTNKELNHHNAYWVVEKKTDNIDTQHIMYFFWKMHL